jgi:phage tail-like protein
MLTFGASGALSPVTGPVGDRVDPYQGFSFLVEIEGILTGGFSECTGLQVETEVFEYREGGVNEYIHRLRGPMKNPPLVLKHGLTHVDGLWRWHQEVAQGQGERRSGTIYLLDRQRLPLVWWDFKEALPIKWTGPELRADSASVAFESVELAHRGLSRPATGSSSPRAGAELGRPLDVSGGF